MKNKINIALPLIAAGLILQGCSSVSSSHLGNEVGSDHLIYKPQWEGKQNSALKAHKLSDLVPDSKIEGLIQKAMKNNIQIKQALIAKKISNQQIDAAKANALPSIDGSLQASNNNGSVNRSASISSSWEIDLWGKVDDALSASRVSANLSELEILSARQSVASSIIKTWLLISANNNYLIIEKKSSKRLSYQNRLQKNDICQGMAP